jgi:hypothetical protein
LSPIAKRPQGPAQSVLHSAVRVPGAAPISAPPPAAAPAPADRRAKRAIPPVPSPRAPANLVPAVPAHPTSVLARQRRENQRGSQSLVARAVLLPRAAPNQHSAPVRGPADSRNPAAATKASPAARENQAALVPAEPDPAANARAASPEGRSEASTSAQFNRAPCATFKKYATIKLHIVPDWHIMQP